jgi:hypothetical protein
MQMKFTSATKPENPSKSTKRTSLAGGTRCQLPCKSKWALSTKIPRVKKSNCRRFKRKMNRTKRKRKKLHLKERV